MSRYGSFAVFALLTLAAAASGAQFMPGAWYAGLAKPSWTPPNWVFPVVWPILYVMIAVAGWRAWLTGARAALGPWGAQLVLNGAWSWLMFGQHRIGAALADLALLWIAIAAFVAMTWRPARAAAMLFLPYLAWVTFAGALNWAVLSANP